MTQRLLALFGGFVILVLCCTGAGAFWLERQMTAPHALEDDLVTVEISEDSSLADAASLLMFYGLVDDPLLWRLRALQRGIKGRVVAGRYQLSTGMSADMMIDRLITSPDSQIGPLKLKIIPGDTIWRVRERLTTLGVADDILLFDKEASWLKHLAPGLPAKAKNAYTRLEGYLAPDTYFLDRESPRLQDAIQASYKQFQRRWKQVTKAHSATYKRLKTVFSLRDRDFITLASLVEKEVAYPPEAPMVAAVFYNRLKRGMKLQTDPTLVYGPDSWQAKPSPRYRRDKKNPYNTYAHTGLPPGPICSPGPQALAAVLNPSNTRALFFVAMRDGSGRHAFSETLEEHRANIQRFLK